MSRTRSHFLLLGLGLTAACSSDIALIEERDNLVVSPQVADAGLVALGQTAEVMLQLDALSSFDIPVRAIDVLNIEGDFFTFDQEMPIVPGDSGMSIPISYTPTELGYHQARITVVSDSKEPEIEVYVRGASRDASVSVWPVVMDFGVVEEGASSEAPFHILNDGNVPLELLGSTFSNETYTGEFVPGAILKPGDQWTVDIVYSAVSEEAATGTLDVDFNVTGLAASATLRGNDCENGTPAAYDVDGDGYTSCSGDCDDNDETAHPGGVEVADGADQDCDGIIDEGTNAYDDDGDGYTEDEGDCNDGDETVNPGATEDMNNGKDDDCDGVTDYGGDDIDGDGYAVDAGDCDDTDDTVFPGATELPDGIDNDCDTTVDEGTVDYDDDGDGMTETAGDCDDTDDTIYKGRPEFADWKDNDCDGIVDETTTNYDDDGDGYTESGGDCDDADKDIGPASLEIKGDGIDNDCDGVTS